GLHLGRGGHVAEGLEGIVARQPVEALAEGLRVGRGSVVAAGPGQPDERDRKRKRDARSPCVPKGCRQWPRAIHSSRCGASSPILVSSPWPVWTTVSGGRVSSRPR